MEPRKRKGIPIGHEDFKEIVTKNCYFVDKTLLIQEILESGAKTMLLTRPRRFGKTLNLSMLRRFFEDERTERGEKIDNGHLFDGFAISKRGAEIMGHQGQYPVINLSLKSAKQPNYEMAYGELKKRISEEFKRHQYVLDGGVSSEEEKRSYRLIMAKDEDQQLYLDALRFLSECLAKYHGKNVFILIDEYDVPLENAYFENFYDKMIAFIRSLFESALKTNPYLEQGVITGCLRISRESVFTGLNNLAVHSMISPYYSDRFGFTEGEVRALLDYYGLLEKYPELQKWYDGYLFGETEIYNPWSVLNYVKLAMADRTAFPRPYWSNTSSNGIIRELVENADEETKAELEVLMDGGVIEKPVHEEITYGDFYASKDNLWNFLFFTGYLKAGKQRLEGSEIYLELSIPNTEIQSVYQRSIVTWFDRRIKKIDRSALIKALEEGDCETAEDFLSQQLMDSISYFDYAEQYYHGFMTGLLSGAGNYSVSSNRESGAGRPDLILTERKFMGKAMVLELKIAEKFTDMEAKCEEALAQMETQQYARPLLDDGYRPILRYAICFFKKGCIVRKG